MTNSGNILWADDEIDRLKPHLKFLEAKNYQVITVTNGHDAIDEIRENKDKMFSFKTVDEKLKFLDGINDYVMNLEQKYSDA